MTKHHQFRTILYISLDAFFASVEQALNPALREQPLVVCGNPHTRPVVAGASFPVRQTGINPGMSLAEAHVRAPQAHFIEGSFSQYEQFSEEFYRILGRFSEYVEPVTLDEAYLELIGFEKQWISPEAVAYEIQKTIARELELPVSIGIASNKVTARAAAKSHKPRQVTYVPWGEEKSFLDRLSPTYLPTVGVRTAEILADYGVHTIGELAAQPASFMEATFGEHSRWLWTLAHGIDNRPVVTPGRSQSVSRSRTFAFATQDETLLYRTLHELLDSACSAIRTTRQVGVTLQIRITTHWGRHLSRQSTIAAPTNSTHELAPVAESLLHDLRRQCSIIIGLHIQIANLKRHNRYSPAFTVSFRKLQKIQASIEAIRRQFGFSATKRISPVYARGEG